MDPAIPDATSNASPSVKITPRLSDLLNDEKLCEKLYKAWPEVERIFSQAQLDLVTEENAATAGPLCLAMRKLRDTFALFHVRGEVYHQAKQNRETPTTKKQ